MTFRMQKQHPFAILGLALLTALSLIFPPAAPFAGAAVIVFVCLRFLSRPRGAATAAVREHREPNLWDDGFGAT